MTDEKYHRSTLAGLRRARRQLEHSGDQVRDKLAPVIEAQRMGGDLQYRNMRKTCREAFFSAGQCVARTIIEMKMHSAPNRYLESRARTGRVAGGSVGGI